MVTNISEALQAVDSAIESLAQLRTSLLELNVQENEEATIPFRLNKNANLPRRVLSGLYYIDGLDMSPQEFVSKVPKCEFRRLRTIGTKSVNELDAYLTKLGLRWR